MVKKDYYHIVDMTNSLAYSKEMAGPIVFLNSEMATYASGVLMEVDYGNTVEEKSKY